jgi:type IV pilus assembly protein PilF
MFSISKKYNIHMKAIMRWNNIKKSKILRIGDVIYLDDPRKAAKS